MATVAEIVTSEILKRLESGVIPWFKPWKCGDGPVNYVTRRPYSGINAMLLDYGEYLTFNQVKQLGKSIRQGARCHLVVYYSTYEVKGKDSTSKGKTGKDKKDDKDTAKEDDEEKVVKRSVLKYYRVVNAEDVIGLESKRKPPEKVIFEIDNCEQVVNDYLTREGIKYNHGGDNAFYRPSTDSITLPLMDNFASAEHYYSTIYHEIGHSTGAKNRLNRDVSNYAREELVAELASSMLCSETGINQADILDNSAAYIKAWSSRLKSDPNAIIYAAAKAEKAYKYVLTGEK